MDGQLIAVIAMIAVAAAYLGRATWKTWSGTKVGCGSGCGKCATKSAPPPKGRFELPQV